MSNGAHPEKTVVDRNVCRVLLDLLEETVPEESGFDSLLLLFHAFESCACENEHCRLSWAQYQEYCRQHGLNKLADLAPGTVRKNASRLSTILLEPACKHLGWSKRIRVASDRPAPQFFPVRLEWVTYQSQFQRLFEELSSLPLEGMARLRQAYTRLSSDQATVEDQTPGTTVQEDEFRVDSKDYNVGPLHKSRQEWAAPDAHKLKPSSMYPPIRTEHCELTRLVCLFEPPAGVGDDVFVHLLDPYFQAFAEIVEKRRGSVDLRVSGQMDATFGYP